MQFSSEQAKRRITADFPLVDNHPDVAGLLRDPELLALTGEALAAPFRDSHVDIVIGPEARGPIVAALVARELGAGLVIVRKADRNHPGADIPVKSEPTWRGESETFQGRSFDFKVGTRAIVVDDWITTGSTIRAVQAILRISGAEYLGASVLVNKASPETIADLLVRPIVAFDDLVG